MKTKPLQLFLITILILKYSENYGQALQITDPNITFAACPGEWIQYNVTNNANPMPSCYYTWTVTNGEIEGGFNDGYTSKIEGYNIQLVRIRWFEVDKSEKGNINIKAEQCDNVNGNDNRSFSIPILSLKGVTPSNIIGNDKVNVNVTTNQVYEVNSIYYPNIGSSEGPYKEVNAYEWEIPTGWTVISGGTSKRITLKPDNCSGGTIRVRGKNTNCSAGPFYSNWSPVKTVTRTLPNPGAITSSTGSTNVVCNDKTPITYSVAPVTGATSYAWTYPLGWTVQGSSTGNSIVLVPNGLNGGSITVKAEGCSIQSLASSLAIGLLKESASAPATISGPTLVCYSGATFTLLNQPANSTINWTLCGGLTLISGQGTPTITVRANTTTTRMSGWISADISTPCGPIPTKQFLLHVGIPDLSSKYSDGELVSYSWPGSPLSYNNVCNLIQKKVVMNVYGGTGAWERILANPTNASWFPSGNDLQFYFYQVGQTATFKYTASNVCGSIAQNYSFKSVNCGTTCTQFAVSPNPANKNIEISPNITAPCFTSSITEQRSDEEELLISSIELYDNYGQLQYSNEFTKKPKKLDIDISELKAGTYYLNIFNGQTIETHRIIKE